MRKLTFRIIFLILVSFWLISCQKNLCNIDPIIPREVIFGNPNYSGVRLSPNGDFLSYLAPRKNVLNIYIKNLNSGKITAITNDQGRGIKRYWWAKNSNYILYTQDSGGDENWRIYSVNVNTREKQVLTPKTGVHSRILKLSKNFPDNIAILSNERNPRFHDVYNVNIITGKRTLIFSNDEFIGFTMDDDLQVKLAAKQLQNGKVEIYFINKGENGQYSYDLFQTLNTTDANISTPLFFTTDGKYLYMLDSTEHDTAYLYKINFETREKQLVFSNRNGAISKYLLNVLTNEIMAVSVNYLKEEWFDLKYNTGYSKSLQFLKNFKDADFQVLAQTDDNNKWLIAYMQDNKPTNYFIFHVTSLQMEFLFTSNVQQETAQFAKQYPVVIKSRDGLDLVSYLTIPHWLDNNGKTHQKLPMVLLVHGGPAIRDTWGYSPVTQWLANRGYVVLQVNYRGSKGFGKAFINAGNGQWSRKMHDDLIDAANWAVENHLADKDKIVIFGKSYGGYATLVGLTKTPDFFAAGIDLVGPTNLVTLLESVPSYWKPAITRLEKRMGGTITTEEGRNFLASCSPLFFADKITKPLLVVQGTNDPRVKKEQSDDIVNTMKKHDIPVTYLLYPDEGHGLKRAENRLSFFAVAESFLHHVTGSRFEKTDGKFTGSSVQILENQYVITDGER